MQLQKQKHRQKQKPAKLENELKEALGDRMAGRIASLWYIRAGLSDPVIPATRLSSFLRNFPADGVRHISANRMSNARDAFGEIIKLNNARQPRLLVEEAARSQSRAGLETVPCLLVRIQGPAYMRLRSNAADISCSALGLSGENIRAIRGGTARSKTT